MDMKEFLVMEDQQVLDLVQKRFGIKINGLEDTKNLSTAWKIVEKLKKAGWTIDIRVNAELKTVDGYRFEMGSPRTIFAQHGYRPNFGSITEGICRTGLIALGIMAGEIV
ncbi:hypothetical protein CH330_06375 [candidate division WOR-3 bacterium JGI_Cruoil_03_51_56]|uniref:Uncharacterized protein n=1 Tax=candidate division WOR-3 bacterium JGI_Cruoil_03_51_56 TaxID=1973747 RepID=A0A235BSG6_UNCW3|nr:MAG: hypothetical protein CH330_06375 [candidate division WOR-3 bacterium JGI_Cruoil_03_51_56]